MRHGKTDCAGCAPAKPKPDLGPGLLVAARMARREKRTIPNKGYLFNYAHDSHEKAVQQGYVLACDDIARECERRAKEWK